MKIKDLLNQYELDSVQAVTRESRNFAFLSGKTAVVSGSTPLTRIIALSLLFCNDEKQLGCEIIVLSKNNIPELQRREDVLIVSSGSLDFTADYWIETGFYDFFQNSTAALFNKTVARTIETLSIISRSKAKRAVLITGTQGYGASCEDVLFSENEQGNCQSGADGMDCALSRTVENLFFCGSKQYGFELIVLRSAVLLGSFSNSSEIDALFDNILNNREVSLKTHTKRVSYIYINDLLTAVTFSLNSDCGVYNVCGDSMTVTNLELGAALDSLFEDCNLNISSGGKEIGGSAVDNTKLKRLGWQPAVCFKDAVLLAVKSLEKQDSVFMFSDAYDGKLTAIQNTLLLFLKEIDRICRKHDIKYFLGGGSLLGAIRHKGFIPWDDDADVMMLRDDYEKFLRVIPDELPDFVFVQTHQIEKASHYPFTKLRIDNTVLATEFSARFPEIHNGVFLDVLAQDKTSKNKLMRKLHIKLTAQLRWLVLNKWRKTPVDANNAFVSFAANIIKAVFPLSLLESAQNRIMKRYNKKDTGLLYDSMGRNVENGAFPEEWLKEAVYVDFENTRLPVPKEYDRYLTYLYGDYMNMVPVSKRHVSHDMVRIDLGRYL